MIKLSIVIVAYKEFDCVSRCLASIPSEPWIEVIVVNNSVENRGFGAGCNVGARMARGQVLLFLNPDSVAPASLDNLFEKVKSRADIGLWGFRLTDELGVGAASIGQQPSRLTALFMYSGLAKRLRRISWIKSLWFDWKVPKKQIEVGVVSGAVMAMKREDFDSVNGFDERFFLYWEEVDLARRIIEQGKKVVFEPAFSFIHSGGLSTDSKQKASIWYRENRYRFFAKHFGKLYGLFLEAWFTLLSEWRLMIGIFLFAVLGLLLTLSDWWMQLPTAWWWYQFPWWRIGISPVLGMVGGVAGLVATILMWYNEAWWLSENKRVISGILIGLLGLPVALTMGMYGILVAFIWALLDLNSAYVFWRRSLVFLWLTALMVSVFLFIVTSFRFSQVSVIDWPIVMEYSAKRSTGTTVSLDCLDCDSQSELALGRLWLDRLGIDDQSKTAIGSRSLRIIVGNDTVLKRIDGVNVGGAVILYSGDRL